MRKNDRQSDDQLNNATLSNLNNDCDSIIDNNTMDVKPNKCCDNVDIAQSKISADNALTDIDKDINIDITDSINTDSDNINNNTENVVEPSKCCDNVDIAQSKISTDKDNIDKAYAEYLEKLSKEAADSVNATTKLELLRNTYSKKKPKKPKKLWQKILSGVFFAVYGVLLACVIFVIVSNLSGSGNGLFGYRIYYILTDSMTPELQPGDTILSKEVKSVDELVVGQYVTFIDSTGKTNTHELIDIFTSTQTGVLMVQTQGIKEGLPPDVAVPADSVEAYMVNRLVIIGHIYRLVRQPVGFALMIIVPLLFMLGMQMISIVKATMERKLIAEIEKENSKANGEQ